MPTREQTIIDAIRVFENTESPTRLNAATAWLGIYRTLLWYEPVNWLGFSDLPHIIDADKLRPASPIKKRSWLGPNAWQRRAEAVNTYLAEKLECPIDAVQIKTDLLMREPEYEGMQRQNTLGIAFAGLIKHVLEQFGSRAVTYRTEVEAAEIFPGISVPGRSSTPRMDVLVSENNIPRAVISCKWSVRHDRVNDITNECPVYKAAYGRIYRQSGHNEMLYYVVTNEYDPARLNKMMGDT